MKLLVIRFVIIIEAIYIATQAPNFFQFSFFRANDFQVKSLVLMQCKLSCIYFDEISMLASYIIRQRISNE